MTYKSPLDIYEVAKQYDWEKWKYEIPFIKFPDNFLVRIIPPFSGAIVRFLVATEDKDGDVSIYLDCYDVLGCYGEPYWEVYGSNDRDVRRCEMKDTSTLINLISDSLDKLMEKRK